MYAENDNDATESWLSEFHSSNATYKSYEQITNVFLLWCNRNNISYNQIQREDVIAYYQFLSSPDETLCGVTKPRDDNNWRPFVAQLSHSSIKLHLRVLKNLFEYLMVNKYLQNNPFISSSKLVNLNKDATGTIDRYLTKEQCKCILRYLESVKTQSISVYQRNIWIFKLLYYSGCRRAEVVNAKMSNIYYRNHNWWFRVTGKGNKIGDVPVVNNLLSALVQYRRFLKLPDYPNYIEDDIPLICNLKNKSLYTSISSSMLYKIVKEMFIKTADYIETDDYTSAHILRKASVHWLRHTCATHQVDAGIDIRVVKDNLRHSLLETTMKYQHSNKIQQHKLTNDNFGCID